MSQMNKETMTKSNDNNSPQNHDNKNSSRDGQNLKNYRLTNSQMHLKSILKNEVLFQESDLDESIFDSELVLKMDVPNQSYIKRSQKMEIGSVLRKFPKALYHAYEAAYEDLYTNMERKGDDAKKQGNNDKQLLIRQFFSFAKLSDIPNIINRQLSQEGEQLSNGFKKEKIAILSTGEYEQINLNCSDEYTGILDSFIITYNSLIYALQQICGFHVKAFLITKGQSNFVNIANVNGLDQIKLRNEGTKKTIYILLHLPHDHLMKTANKFKIKKQINYPQIDPFLNDPTDSVKRPLRYNTAMKQMAIKKNMDQAKEKTGNLQSEHSVISQKFSDFQLEMKRRKTIDRKIGFNLPDLDKGTAIINEVKPKDWQVEKFINFSVQFDKKLHLLMGSKTNHNCFNDPEDEDHITPEEKDYLMRINRFKYNPGVQRRYVQIKKQRKYFQILKQLSAELGYQIFDSPLLFSQFKLANKNKKFFHRLERILLYKELIVGPYGQLDLFNKMQRIKLSYSLLRENIRVQNLYMLNCTVFTLTDEYEKFGKIGTKNSSKFHYHYIDEQRPLREDIFGGLNGRSLEMDWHRIFIWVTDYNTLRNYLGESKAFQVFIKTAMIYLFVFLTPLGILFEVVKNAIVAPKASSSGYFPEFWFYLSYMVIATIVYGIFIEKYRRSEQNFIKNSVEDTPVVQFLSSYRGPYLRDNINDNANTYDSKFILSKDRLLIYLMLLIMFLIVGAEIGFYYGMRAAIVALSYEIPQFDTTRVYFLYPIHLIGYSIFFVVNAIFYRFCVIPLASYLTKFENRPTKSSFKDSEQLKLYIFAIGIQMIGPIDLVFIQYSEKTSCHSSWCADQIQAYVYCRYIIMIIFTVLSALDMLRKYFKNKKLPTFDQGQEELTFRRRFSLYLEFVDEQSEKQQCSDIRLVDQTVALIHFATFLTIFPLAPAISFVSMLIDYNVQRMEILKNQQRPIPKSQQLQTFRKIVVAIGHWMIFYNFAQLFITLEWMEYLFQNVVYAILPIPTPYSLMTLKYSVIIFFMIIFEVLLALVKSIVQKTHSVMDKRKWNMFEKYGIKALNAGSRVVLKQPKPLHSISRTYNIKKRYNINDSQTESQGEESDGQRDSETHGQLRVGKNKSGKKGSKDETTAKK